MTLLYIAAIILALHGLIEFAALPALFRFRAGSIPASRPGITHFVFEPLRVNLRATMAIGIIFGILRVVATVGILLNLLWGLWLGVAVSVVTLVVMTLFLPMGVVDGVLSTAALILLFIAAFGTQPIV